MPVKQRRDSKLRRTIGNRRWMDRQRSLIAIDFLIQALSEGCPVEKRSARHLHECLTRWRSAAGELTLEEALHLPARGLRHPLEERLIGDRNYAYAHELVVLIALGFKPKEADFAVAERFRLDPPEGLAKLRPLAVGSVEELRKEILTYRGPEPELNDPFRSVKEDVATWDRDRKSRYLAAYPTNALPVRFRS